METIGAALITTVGLIIIQLLRRSMKENRTDHNIVIDALTEVKNGHRDIAADLRDTRADVRQIKNEVNDLSRTIDQVVAETDENSGKIADFIKKSENP